MIRKVQLTLLLVFTTFVINAQTGNYITGKVLDENGVPAQYASVYITEIKKGTSVDEKGHFTIDRIEEGLYTLEIRKVGYSTFTKSVTIGKGENVIEVDLEEYTEVLDEVSITGDALLDKEVVTVNRLNTKEVDMPGSSTIITSEIMREQQIIRLSEALRNVAGVYMFNKGHGGTSETVGARGVSLRYLGFMFRDGIRFGTNQSLATPEVQAYERIEVLKGGAGINFGYVSPGATINYVTKKPSLSKNGGYVSIRAGSYRNFGPSIDYNLILSKKLAARVISTTTLKNSFRETVKTRRYFNSGSFLYKASESTNIFVGIDYLHDETPRDFGLPFFENRIVTGKDAEGKNTMLQTTGTQQIYRGLSEKHRSRFIGSSFNNRNSSQLNANIRLNQKINDKWNLRVRTATSQSSYDYIQTGSGFRNKYELEGDDVKITRTQETEAWEESTYGAVANLTGQITLATNVVNNISASLDYDDRTQISDSYPYVTNFDYVYLSGKETTERTKEDVDKYRTSTTNFRGVGLSLQNLVSINDKLNILLSLRADEVKGYNEREYFIDGAELKGKVRGSTKFKKGDITKTEHDDFAFTPSFGLTYKFSPKNSLYTSYTNSFSPNKNGYLDVDGGVLSPYYIEQFEIGTKNTFLDGKITTNIAYYQIQDKSYLETDIDDVYEISPGSSYKGLELEASMALIENLDVSFNYSNVDAAFGAGGSRKEGTRPQQTPEHQFGFWTNYKFAGGLENFSVNFGGEYTGARLGNDYFNRDNIHPYIQDAFWLLNAGVGYEKNKLNLQLKVTNLLNEFVFYSYRYGSVNPIAPTQFALTATYKL